MTNKLAFFTSWRLLFFILLMSGSAPGWSQSNLEWAQRDTAIFQYANPLATFQEAADTLASYLSTTRPETPSSSYLSDLYHFTALWYYRAGDYDLAFQWVDKALLTRQQISETTLTQLARTENLKGEAFYQNALYVPAARWFDRSLQTLEKAISKGEALKNNLNRKQYYTERVAATAIHLGDYGRAKLVLNKLPEYFNNALAYGSMKDGYIAKRKIARAICWGLFYEKQELFTQADSVFQSITYTPADLDKSILYDLAILRGNHGYNNILAKDYRSAEQNIGRAIDLFNSYPMKSSEVYSKLTAQYGFLAMCQEATDQFSALKTTVQKGAAAGAKAAKKGRAKQLGTLYTYAALGAARAEDFPLADTLMLKGKVALIKYPDEEQLPTLSNAIVYGEEELQEWFETKQRIDLLKFEHGVFPHGRELALEAADKLDTLLRKSWGRLNLTNSRSTILKDQRKHVQAAVNIALDLYQDTQDPTYLAKAYNYVANLKGNILKSRLLGPSLAKSIKVPPSVLKEKTRLELASLSIEKQLQSNQGVEKVLRDSLLKLDTRLHRLKYDLGDTYPAYAQLLQNESPLNPDDIAQSLSQNQQLCEFHLTEDTVLVFSISRLKGLRLIVLPKPNELEKDIEGLLIGNTQPSNLYDALLAPVIEEGITRLQLIPDGILWRLPFQSLKTPNGNYLIEEYAISYAYAAPVLLNQKLKRSVSKTRKKYLGYGIDYADLLQGTTGGDRVSTTQNTQHLRQLPFATSEVQRAADIMGGEVILNEDVTKSSFLSQAPSANIIHLSMHGMLAIDPLANALLFHAEGNQAYVPFSISEVLAQRMDPELTVLSSCHTGGGPIILAEGMFSIGSAFTVGGSKSTLTSTWGANDAITHDIMVAFYQHLNKGAPKDIALQHATIEHLKRGSPAEGHPRNWANLSLNGSTAPLNQHKASYWRWCWWLLLLIPLFGLRHLIKG